MLSRRQFLGAVAGASLVPSVSSAQSRPRGIVPPRSCGGSCRRAFRRGISTSPASARSGTARRTRRRRSGARLPPATPPAAAGRRAGRPLPDRRDPAGQRRQPAPRGRGDAGLQPRRAAVPAAGADALRRHRADELLAVHLRVRGGEHRDHREQARSTARPTRTRGGTGAATVRRRSSKQAAARERLLDMGARGVPVARAGLRRGPLSAARTSSSRTAAATCSSRA